MLRLYNSAIWKRESDLNWWGRTGLVSGMRWIMKVAALYSTIYKVSNMSRISNVQTTNVFDASKRTRGSERRGRVITTLRRIGTRESVSERYHFLFV